MTNVTMAMALLADIFSDNIESDFVLSSDSTFHCAPERRFFQSLTTFDDGDTVRTTTGQEYKIEGVGTVRAHGFYLHDVLFVPSHPVAIISLSTLVRSAGLSFEFSDKGVVQNHSSLDVSARGGTFTVKLGEEDPSLVGTESSSSDQLKLCEQWVVSTSAPRHLSPKRLDHVTFSQMQLKKIHFEPRAILNVISVTQLVAEGFRVFFDEDTALISNNDYEVVMRAPWKDGLYICKKPKLSQAYSCSLISKAQGIDKDANDLTRKQGTRVNQASNSVKVEKNAMESESSEEVKVVGLIERTYRRSSPHKWAFTDDSNCHATHDKSMLSEYREFKRDAYVQVRSHYRQLYLAHGMGTVHFDDFSVSFVLYVPDLECNIVSLQRLHRIKNITYKINDNMLTIFKCTGNGSRIVYNEAACSDYVWILTWRGR